MINEHLQGFLTSLAMNAVSWGGHFANIAVSSGADDGAPFRLITFGLASIVSILTAVNLILSIRRNLKK